MSFDVVEVVQDADVAVVDVLLEPIVVEVVMGLQGPPGPVGPAHEVVHNQFVPAGTWSVAHDFGRRPQVSIYVGDEEVESDVFANESFVTVQFPTPTTGQLILT